MRILRKLFATLILLSLISCGGGGGGGSSSGGSFQITLDKSSVSLSVLQGETGSPAVVTARASGTYSGTIYVGAVVEGRGIDPDIPFSASGDTAQFSLYVASGLAIGTYTGKVLLYACSDPNCNNPIGGTPLTVTYTVVVQANIDVTPSTLSMSAVSGNTATANLTVTLPSGAISFTATAQGNPSWLQLGAPSGSTLPVLAKSLRSGTYTANIQVTANTGQVKTIPVTYTVSPPAGGEHDLIVTPSQLTFSASQGGVSQAQTLSLSLPTWDPTTSVTYSQTYTNDSGWLTVTPTSNGANIVASAVALSQGTYTAQVRVTPQSGTAVSVPVTLTVGTGLIAPSGNAITVNSETTSADLQGSVTINAGAGVSPFTWTATSSASWLTLTRATGLTGTNLSYQVDLTALQALTNFADAVATVTVSSAGPAMTPVQFSVTLHKQLPEAYYLGPYLLVNGRTATVYVRGRGFNSISSVSSRLQATGLTPSAVTRINDTEIRMQVTPSSATNFNIGISNALGLTTSSAVLKVISPQTYTYAAIPTAGNKRAMVLDAQRQSIYAVNVDSDALTRFRFSGSTWNIDALPLAGILDAGMGPDGNSLVVTSTPGTLRLLDPTTLSTQFSLNVPEGLARNFTYVSQGISTTNNGRSWLTTGTGSWDEFSYFDHQTRTLQPRPTQSSLSTSFYSGPWTSIARNGERMLVVQTGSLSPSPPMLYLDAADSLLQTNPASLTFSYDMQMSDDGNRVMFDWYEVRDANFNLIGRTRIPSTDGSYFGVAGAMSPDGTRAYILAYRNDALNNSPTTTIKPRVYVFNSSTFSASSTDLPVVGSFDLTDYPTCRVSSYSCNYRPKAAISPDGNTLFFMGDVNFVVVPIPSGMKDPSIAKDSVKANGFMKNIGVPGALTPLRPWTPLKH